MANDKILPYNKMEYFDFLDDENHISNGWYGVSFQIKDSDEKKVNINDVDLLEPLFKKIILEIDKETVWIVNHFYKNFKWFPNNDYNLKVFRELFKESKVPTNFKGSLIFKKDDLLECARDLISYSFILSWSDLDISNNQFPFILKLNQHLTIDIVTKDKMLLRKIVTENSSNYFNIKEYRGSTLWL